MEFPLALILLFSIAFFIGGIRLLKRGHWPARVGNDPHCKACGYLLVGITSDRCPECGGTLTAENIVHGMRKRRGGLTAAGIIWILLGILPFAIMMWSQWNSIDWIRFEPASFLVRNVKTSFAFPAWQELKRRGANGSLNDAQIQTIVEIALPQQSAAVRCPIADELVAFAGDQFLAGKMTASQKTRFCQQSLQLSLVVRPQVAQGQPVPYTLAERSGCPNGSWWVTDSIRAIKLDGKTIEDFSGAGETGGGENGLGASGSLGSTIKCSTIGKHQLGLVVRRQLYHNHGIFDPPSNYVLIDQEDRELSADFEVAK